MSNTWSLVSWLMLGIVMIWMSGSNTKYTVGATTLEGSKQHLEEAMSAVTEIVSKTSTNDEKKEAVKQMDKRGFEFIDEVTSARFPYVEIQNKVRFASEEKRSEFEAFWKGVFQETFKYPSALNSPEPRKFNARMRVHSVEPSKHLGTSEPDLQKHFMDSIQEFPELVECNLRLLLGQIPENPSNEFLCARRDVWEGLKMLGMTA